MRKTGISDRWEESDLTSVIAALPTGWPLLLPKYVSEIEHLIKH